MSFDFYQSAVSKINNGYEYLNSYEYDALLKGAKYGDSKQKQESRDAFATAKLHNNKAFGLLNYRDSAEESFAREGRPKYY